jgi:hypothetical protein
MSNQFQKLWSPSAPLTAVAILMLLGMTGAFAGLFLDSRVITGDPAWLKPAKFGASTALYAGTVAWLLRYVNVWPRFVRWMGRLLALALTVEVTIIFIQAARGTTSHFNTATPLDMALFRTMGMFIGLLWLSSVGILAALFRQSFQSKAWGWALRLGMLITVLGAAAGGFMLHMTPAQAQAAEHHLATTSGAHTVGAPDGGPGIPLAGWSAEHGDLRIAHFVGLHGIQVIPFFAWLLARRRWPEASQSKAVFVSSASYAALIAILAWQALRGQSIVQPDALTTSVFLTWLAVTLAALGTAVRGSSAHAASWKMTPSV